MIFDSAGKELTFWHVTGLIAGQDSETLVIAIDCPQDSDLTVVADERVQVWARLNGTADPFQNITTDPIDLRPLSGRILFDISLAASPDAEGFDRVALTPGAVFEDGAAWRE